MTSIYRIILASLIFFFSISLVDAQISTEGKKEISSSFQVWKIQHEMNELLDKDDFLDKRVIGYRNFVKPFNCQYPIDISKIDSIKFPLDDYSLYQVKIEDKWICGEKIIVNSQAKNYSALIAYNPNGEKIVFISGPFYLSRISRYFNFETSNELQLFLQLKLNDFSIVVDNKKEDKDWIYIDFESSLVSQTRKAKFEKSNPDIIYILK